MSHGYTLVNLCNCLCHTVMSGSCYLEVTCWERADLMAFLFMMSFLFLSLFHSVFLAKYGT